MIGFHGIRSRRGFTMIELIMVMLLIGILSVVVIQRLPTNMAEEAAVRELRRAIRLAQHQAMTRQYTAPGTAWGITVTGNQYSVQRQGADCAATPIDCAGADYQNRFLLNDNTMTLIGGPVWFNGLGEPIDPDGSITGTAGSPLTAATTFTVANGPTVTVSPRTGYVQ